MQKGQKINMKKNHLCILIVLFALISSCTARQGQYDGNEYSFHVSYSDIIGPGDVVFINMSFVPNENLHYTVPSKATMTLTRKANGKNYGTVELFTVRQDPPVLFATIPTSTYLDPGELTIEVQYDDPAGKAMKFELPVKVNEREFIEEILHLNATNTAIKTDTDRKSVV